MIFLSILLGGVVGVASERFGLTQNGYIISIALGLGGAMILWLAQSFFGIGFGFSRGVTSMVGAALLLFIASLRK